MRPINRIVLHCSATKNGKSLSPTQSPAAVIDGWHKERGFRRDPSAVSRFNPELPSIGYHFVVDLDGHVHTGRAIAEVGAHVAGYNSDSIGICLIGYDKFTVSQWDAAAQLVTALADQFQVPLAFANVAQNAKARGVLGHRDFSPDKNGNGRIEPFEWLKTCPGFSVESWFKGGMLPIASSLLERLDA